MVLTNRDPNGPGSGRTSRASDLSAMSRRTNKHVSETGGGPPRQDLLASAGPGVMSMLRTSTEMTIGDVQGAGPSSRTSQHRGVPSRRSTASSLSNHSQHVNMHRRQNLSSSSTARQGREIVPDMPYRQYHPDPLPPTMVRLPGSSPLPLLQQRVGDPQRSSSMTYAMQQPELPRLSNNRSMGSLPNYAHPAARSSSHLAQLGRHPGQVHPARTGHWYDQSVSGRGRPPTNLTPEQAYLARSTRTRAPSHENPGFHMERERLHRSSRSTRHGQSSGFYHQMPYAEASSMAPFRDNSYTPMAQARSLNQSTHGSSSSHSTNVRTDSDTPSSDLPGPSTPRNGTNKNAFVDRPRNQRYRDVPARPARGKTYTRPKIIDGSEQIEYSDSIPSDSEPTPMSLKDIRNKKRLEREFIKQPSHFEPVKNVANVGKSQVPVLAELPASPVPRPITREMVRKGLEPVSTTDNITSSISSPVVQGGSADDRHNPSQVTAVSLDEDIGSLYAPPTIDNYNRHSVSSQVGSSVLDSSTLDCAVRYPIPVTTAAGNNFAAGHASVPTSPGSFEKNTEDGMSELLAGYQHTASKQDEDIVPTNERQHQSEPAPDSSVERANVNAWKSPDKQLSKPKMDVARPAVTEASQNKEVNSIQSTKEPSPERVLPVDMDELLSQMCTADKALEKAMQIPPSRLRSSVSHADWRTNIKESSLFSSTSFGKRSSKTEGTPSESSLSVVANKLRGSSKSRNSGASSTPSVTQQPPVVPPRESSISKEAQRTNAAGASLMRRIVPTRFTKDKRLNPELDLTAKTNAKNLVYQTEPVGSDPSLKRPLDISKDQEKAFNNLDVVQEMQKSTASIACSNTAQADTAMLAPLSGQPFEGPRSVTMPDASSAYSPRDTSTKAAEHSSPANVPLSAEHNGRDSRTTTHLSWAGHGVLSNALHSVSEPHLPLSSGKEDTTANLKLPKFQYNASQDDGLRDLKEEPHEDFSPSSSASNAGPSRYQFAESSGSGLPESVDMPADALTSPELIRRRECFEKALEKARDVSMDATRRLPTFEFDGEDLFGHRQGDFWGDDLDANRMAKQCEDEMSALFGDLRQSVNRLKSAVSGTEQEKEQAYCTGVSDVAQPKRTCSPPNLMEEINQVTIPSVSPLTERFTELLPSLSLDSHVKEDKVCGLSEGDLIEQAIEEIHGVHAPTEKRSSRRLRPVSGSPALLVVEDDVFEEITNRKGDSVIPGEQQNGEVKPRVSETGTRVLGKDKNTTRAPADGNSTLTEPHQPSHKVLRPRSYTLSEGALRTSVESVLSSGSPKSFASTPTATTTRPWNYDRNYPWNITASPSIDISLPSRDAVKQSPRAGPSHLRNTLSDVTTSTFTSSRTANTFPTGVASNSVSNRHSNRLSTFGHSGDQSHAVGERYPTTALSLPTPIFRDHLTASDTSDDEEFEASDKTRVALKKRLSSVARSSTLLLPTRRVARVKVNPIEPASPVQEQDRSLSAIQDCIREARARTSNRHTFRGAEGMRYTTYHRQRTIDSLKRWWSKGLALELLLHRRLVCDYSWEARIGEYESEIEFEPDQYDPMPEGPPPPPPNTPVSSPPASTPGSPLVNGIQPLVNGNQ